MLIFEGERRSVDAVALSPDGRYLVVKSDGVFLRALADPGAAPVKLKGCEKIFGFLSSGRLAVAEPGGLRLVQPERPGHRVIRHAIHDGPDVRAVLPNDRVLTVFGGADATTFRLYHVDTKGVEELTRFVLYGQHTVSPFAVAHDGSRLAEGFASDIENGKPRSAVALHRPWPNRAVARQLSDAPGHLRELVWSPCGRFIAGVLGARLVVWSVEDGTATELATHTTRLFRSPCFHPSGRFLAAGGANIDGGVYSWEVGSWREIAGHHWPIGPIACVCFSADGSLAAAGSEKGRVTVWDVD